MLIALPKTNKVLSKIDLIIIFPNSGFLYGGSSSIKEEGVPFKIVFDKILEITKVKNIPNNITNNTQIVETIEDKFPVKQLPIKIVEMVIKIGNLPITWNKTICQNGD